MALYYAHQYVTTTLSKVGGLNDSDTTGIVLASTDGIDTAKPGIALLSYQDPLDVTKAEWITYTSIDGSKELQGVTRGQEGSTAKQHDNGCAIAFPISESHINNLNAALSIGGSATNHIEGFKDEDDMASNSPTHGVTQQSVKAYVDSQTNTTGWTADTDTWVYVAANQFKIEGKDVTARFPKGTKLKFTQTSAKYAIVSAAAFSTDTTVTIVTNNDYTIANAAIESPYYSYQASPQGFPGYFNYTPTLSRSGGDYDNAPTLNSATYSVNGRTATVCVRYTLHATPGSSGTMIVTQPTGLVTANNTVIMAWNGSSGVAMTGNCNTNGNINIYKYDGLAEATEGNIYQVTAIYHT